MVYKVFDGLSQSVETNHSTTLSIEGDIVQLPDASFVRDAEMTRDGMDLVLDGPQGHIVVEDYFAAEPTPNLVAPDGSTLTPDLVHSFAKSDAEFASNNSATDESPIGAVQEVAGEATVTHVDGTSETISIGTQIYQGDIIETNENGAVNIVFNDETSFAVSEDARLAIDEYVFDPTTQSGETNFSVLKGVFVFTSGLIGRDDPDDVQIDTPVGSIGIRGTIIAGNVDTGEITVVEGAIVLRDHAGNEMTLANQFETAQFLENGQGIQHIGELSATDMSGKYNVISDVAPGLFSSIQDTAAEQQESVSEEIQLEVQPEDEILDAPMNTDAALADEGADASEVPADATVPVTSEVAAAEIVQTTDNKVLPPPPAGFGETTEFGTNTSGLINTAVGPALPPPPPLGFTGPAATTFAPPPPPPAAGDTGTQQPVTTTTTTTDNAPVFSTNVTLFAFAEDVASTAVVARIVGVNGVINSIANITLSGALAASFEVIASGANTFDIRLRGGEMLDYDAIQLLGIPTTLSYTATSAVGQNSNGNIALQLTETDEAPQFTPHLIDSNPGGATEHASLSGVETGTWSYHFNKEFISTDFNDPLTYSLSTATINALDTWETGPLNILADWNFNATTGELQLFFDAAFNFTPSTAQNLTLNVIASDGTNTATHDYVFQAFNDIGTPVGGALNANSGGVHIDPNDGTISNTLNIGLTGAVTINRVYMLDGDDTVNFIESTGSFIDLGNGNNTLNIAAATTNMNNKVVGGSSTDTFNIQNANNSIYGGDGDDDFILHLGSGVGTWLQNPANQGLATVRFEGGWSGFRAAERLDDGDLLGSMAPHGGGAHGRGDSIVLNGAGNIDFTAIDNAYFKGIERLDAQNGLTNNVILNYADVMQMTDSKRTLIINLDNVDNLTFNDQGNMFTKVGDDVAFNDARQGEAPDAQNYDVYTDGIVTLLIADTGGTVTGLPA